MKDGSTWQFDLARAGTDELFVGSMLEDPELRFTGKSPPGTVGWDIKLTYQGHPYTVEVKSDYKTADSGLVALEFGRVNGDRSGLMATTADLVAYLVSRPHNRFVLCLGVADTFRDLISDSRWKERRGGDGQRTLMKLVPYLDFIAAPGMVTVGKPFTR